MNNLSNEETKFNPKRLKEARLVRGFTISELAPLINVSKQAVSQFELGESIPKSETMMNIINTLRFPKSFFFREYKEQYVGNTFFRANASASKKSKEEQFNKSLLAGYIYEYLEQYIDFPQINLPDLSGFAKSEWDDNSIEDLAKLVRSFWDLGDKPITNLVNTLERNGIMVFSVDTDSEKVDAFCQHRKGRPFIFLGNDKQSAVRRQFDAAHELGHVLMHKEIHNQDVLTRDEFKRMEYQANLFASAFLLPNDAFTSTVTSTSLFHFIELKKYWHVSIAAMLYRGHKLGILDESKYTSLVKHMSIKKIRINEPLDDVLPVQDPTVLKRSINLLIANKLKSEIQIIHEVGIAQDFIEMLCGLDKGSLNTKDPEPLIRLAFANEKQ